MQIPFILFCALSIIFSNIPVSVYFLWLGNDYIYAILAIDLFSASKNSRRHGTFLEYIVIHRPHTDHVCGATWRRSQEERSVLATHETWPSVYDNSNHDECSCAVMAAWMNQQKSEDAVEEGKAV